LDVIVLLEKLRDSYELQTKMHTKKYRNYMQFNKQRVIVPDEAEEEN